MNKIQNFAKENRRLILFIIVASIAVYIGYIALSHFMSDNMSGVHITMYKSENNIITAVDGEYKMKMNKGNLSLSSGNEKLSDKKILSYPFSLETINGQEIDEVKIKITYDDSSLPISEDYISIAEVEDGKIKEVIKDCSRNADENTIEATLPGRGKWCLIDNSK